MRYGNNAGKAAMTQMDIGAIGQSPVAGDGQLAGLYRVEVLLVTLILGLLLATFGFDALRPAVVDWPAFAGPIVASLAMIALGGFIRARRPMKRMAAFAIGFGIFMGFSAVVAVFIYLMFPFSRPPVDPTLIAWDARLGYDWVAFVTWLTAHPLIGRALGMVYMTSIPQLVLVIVLLAWSGQERALHRFLATGIVGMCVTVAIWWWFPSIGPSPFVTVPAAAETIGLIHNQAYADQLMRLATEGIAVIRPDVVMGVIAFPSFHMFMACMVVWFSRTTPVASLALAVNSVMIPATLSHGGHHLVDLMAAVALFSLVAFAVGRAVRGR